MRAAFSINIADMRGGRPFSNEGFISDLLTGYGFNDKGRDLNFAFGQPVSWQLASNTFSLPWLVNSFNC